MTVALFRLGVVGFVVECGLSAGSFARSRRWGLGWDGEVSLLIQKLVGIS